MIIRIDKLQIEMPMPSEPAPEAAAAVQELMGGKFGEMSTLMNYTFQSFNFRGRKNRQHRHRGVRARRARGGDDKRHAHRRFGRRRRA